METEITPIGRACKSCGSATALATLLGCSPQFISQLVNGHRRIPAEYCPAIERFTRGLAPEFLVTCEELRPDIPWIRDPLPSLPEPVDAEPKAA